MDKEYQYRPYTHLIHGGYEGEPKGVYPDETSWVTTSNPSGSATYSYYYTDTNTADGAPANHKNANSSKVFINATDDWSVDIGSDNIIHVTITTTINSIERRDILGNPNYLGTWGRDIRIRRNANGRNIINIEADPIGYAHSLIRSPISLGTEKFDIRPGEGITRYSFYVLNHTSGLDWGPDHYDEFEAGISFQNILPDDYRPFAVWTGSVWGSCNRPDGMDAVWTGSQWIEMRSDNGGVGTDNPPYIYNGSRFVNQSKVGQGG